MSTNDSEMSSNYNSTSDTKIICIQIMPALLQPRHLLESGKQSSVCVCVLSKVCFVSMFQVFVCVLVFAINMEMG